MARKRKPDPLAPLMYETLHAAFRIMADGDLERGTIVDRGTQKPVCAIILVSGEAATAEVLAAVEAVEKRWKP